MTNPADTPAPPLSAASSLVGEMLSERYRIEALLGEGGMGAVYLAEHVLMHKRVAVKVLHPEMTRMPEIVARFEREAMAAAHIEHPNVAAATDFGKLKDGAFFLVLEYVEGRSLRDLIGGAPLAQDLALHITSQIAAALGRAHALGIVHRDLKPENVMLVERDGDKHFVKVLDFGVAKVPVGELSRRDSEAETRAPLTQLGMVYGTPEYMAPEQALGQEVDARADLYALGVIAFEMLTGVRPFEAASKVALLGMKVTTDPPTMGSKNPEVRVAPAIEALVSRLLHREASARFQQAREVVEAIEQCKIGEDPTDRPRAPMASAGQRPWFTPAKIAPLDAGAVGGAQSETSVAGWPAVWKWVRAANRKMPAIVRSVPPLGIIGVVSVVLLVALLASIAAVRDEPKPIQPTSSASAASVETPPEPPAEIPSPRQETATTAGAEELALGIRSGTSALEKLKERYPADPAVLRALARAYMKDKRGVDAMRAVGKLFALSEAAGTDDSIKEMVRTAAQGSPETSDAAFSLMQSGLGSKGPDWLYELTTRSGISPRIGARAKQTLAKPSVRTRMSPALAVAWDLKNAGGCDGKRGLLPRAKQYGDARALPLLRSLQATKGCGFLDLSDCWACLHRDGNLAATIDAIEDRSGAP